MSRYPQYQDVYHCKYREMAHDDRQDSEQLSDNWFSNFEDECLEDLDTEPNMDARIQTEQEFANQKLWMAFQNSATSVAQLYKDRHQGLSVWIPFQNAAGSVTTLYRESTDCLKNSVDIGIQTGRQHRTRDILAWVKKRRRHIRREDLLAFLAGRNPPPRNRHVSTSHSRPPPRVSLDRASPCLHLASAETDDTEPDLQTFRDALALQGLNGAMSNVSVGYLPHGTPPTAAAARRNNMEELNRFILDEITRNCDARKRTSNSDVLLDSPVRKRGRLL